MVFGIIKTEVGNASIQVNAPQFEALFRQAPAEVATQARTMIGRWFGHTRQTIQKNTTPGLRRAIKKHGWVFWRVEPFTTEKGGAAGIRRRFKANPNLGLESIVGKYRLRSSAEIAHEFGATVRATKARALAIPLQSTSTRRRKGTLFTPSEYAQTAEGQQRPLFVVSRRSKGQVVRKLVRETGETLASGKPKLEALFVLKKQVRIEPKLGVRESWDADAGYRQGVLEEHLRRAVEALSKQLRTAGRRAG